MPYINRIFQSLEKIAACETRVATCIEHSELIKAGRVSFLTRLWSGLRNLFRRKAVPKKTPTSSTTTNPVTAPKQTSTAPATASATEQATKVTPATGQAATEVTKAAPATEQAAAEAATAAKPGLIARHPYLAMAGSAGTAGLATYWLTPTKHYTPPPANDYAVLDELYQERMRRA